MRYVKKYLLNFSHALIFSILVFSTLSSKAQPPVQNAFLKAFLDNSELKSAHVGVYVYDDSSKNVIADYQSDKYFIPASNVKLFSLYAGMKYLGDSILGLRYSEVDTALFIFATGDPSFLHPDFSSQPVFDFLKKINKKIYLVNDYGQWCELPWGPGWAWDDYNEDYSVERSPFPVYGNFIRWEQQKSVGNVNPLLGPTASVSSSPEIPWKVRFSGDSMPKTFLVKRLMDSNVFIIRLGNETDISQDVPFITHGMDAAAELLRDTLGKSLIVQMITKPYKHGFTSYPPLSALQDPDDKPYPFNKIYSRPVDSVFMPMMYRSDNFFAEQTLLMISNQQLHFMKDDSVIQYILNGPLADLPQKPKWVDGSGLSRYNLFTPQDFVRLLVKFKNEFGMERMKRILPTGKQGTLKNYLRGDSGFVYAKTGSMSGVVCISGYLYTNRKRLLEFSILVNNNAGGNSAIRHTVENYIEYLQKNN